MQRIIVYRDNSRCCLSDQSVPSLLILLSSLSLFNNVQESPPPIGRRVSDADAGRFFRPILAPSLPPSLPVSLPSRP